MPQLFPDDRCPGEGSPPRPSARRPVHHHPDRVAVSGRRFGLRIRVLGVALALAAGALFSSTAHAQRSADLGFTYSQERSKFLGDGKDDYFYLRGATIDYSWNMPDGLGISVGGTGLAVTNLRGSIDIHQVTFLAGPRYTFNLGHISPTHLDRKGSVFIEGKGGYTFATTGQYPDSTGEINNTGSGLTYSAGAGLNLHLYQRFDLRLFELDYVRTQLPNGTTNVQNTLRMATGINFHLGF